MRRRGRVAALAVVLAASGCSAHGSPPSDASTSAVGRLVPNSAASTTTTPTTPTTPTTTVTGLTNPVPGATPSRPATRRSAPPTTAGPATGRPIATSGPATGRSAPGRPGTSGPTSATGQATTASTCRHLMIRVIPGSAAQGYEFAALQFLNTGANRCTLDGYPQARLRRRGQDVGTPAQPGAAGRASHFALAPGAVAQSDLRDYSGCQAPLSDAISVTAPGSTIASTQPIVLRACRLRVYPLSPHG